MTASGLQNVITYTASQGEQAGMLNMGTLRKQHVVKASGKHNRTQVGTESGIQLECDVYECGVCLTCTSILGSARSALTASSAVGWKARDRKKVSGYQYLLRGSAMRCRQAGRQAGRQGQTRTFRTGCGNTLGHK
jgi:hypothetical protein